MAAGPRLCSPRAGLAGVTTGLGAGGTWTDGDTERWGQGTVRTRGSGDTGHRGHTAGRAQARCHTEQAGLEHPPVQGSGRAEPAAGQERD